MYSNVSSVGVSLCRCSILVSILSFVVRFIIFKLNLLFSFRTECFCGNTEPPTTAKLPDPECNYKCIGDPKQICGGYFTINIYETGISSK